MFNNVTFMDFYTENLQYTRDYDYYFISVATRDAKTRMHTKNIKKDEFVSFILVL